MLQKSGTSNNKVENVYRNKAIPLTINSEKYSTSQLSIKTDLSHVKLNQRRSFSPITNRLRSLVNTNSNSMAMNPISVMKNDNNEFYPGNKLKNKLLKCSSLSHIAETAKDVNHERLRGFFKHINAEKSGLRSSTSIVGVGNLKRGCHNRSKIQMDMVSDENNYLIESSQVELLENNDLSELDKDVNNNDIEGVNINVSNSSAVCNKLYSNRSTENDEQSSNDSESNLSDGNTLNHIKHYSTNDKWLTDKRNPLNGGHHNPVNKLSYMIQKMSKNRTKSRCNNSNSFHLHSFKVCSNQKKYTDCSANNLQPAMAQGDFESKVDNDHSHSSELSINDRWTPGKDFPFEDLEYDTKKPKLKLTKKLFKIFSQSSFPKESKKNKMVLTTVESVSKIAFDGLINLITILSVELIISAIKSKEQKRAMKNKLLKRESSSKSFLNNKRGDESIKFPNSSNAFSKPRISSASVSSSQKSNLLFDMNGRLLLNDGTPAFGMRSRRQSNMGSMVNIGQSRNSSSSNLRYNNASSMVAIPSGYQATGYSTPSSNQKLRYINQLNDHKTQINQSRSEMKISTHDVIRSAEKYPNILLSSHCRSNSIGNYARPNSSVEMEEIKRKPLKKQTSIASSSSSNNPVQIGNNGRYKCCIPLKTKIDAHQLDDVFSLKNDIYDKCENSIFYIRSGNSNVQIDNDSGLNSSWIIYLECPTAFAMNSSLRMITKRFAYWKINIRPYIIPRPT